VMRVRSGVGVLGERHIWEQSQAQPNRDRRTASNQAVFSASIFSGSNTGGSGISSG
jgi:hypothetical protein